MGSRHESDMSLIGNCICGFVLTLTAVVSAQQNGPLHATNVSVSVLENNSAILAYAYNQNVTSESSSILWHELQNGSSSFIGVISCTDNEGKSVCKFMGPIPHTCSCNKTYASLVVITNVSRNDQGRLFSGEDNQRQLNFWYTLDVTVPVQSVVITNVSKSTVTFAENKKARLECKSSASRPNATIKWEHNSVTLDNALLEGIPCENLFEMKSTLSFFPDKTMNGNNITCKGNNTYAIKYDWVTLNVTYGPAGSPIIDHLPDNAEFAVIESKNSTLNCTVFDGNPPAQLDWTCNDTDNFKVSDVNITSRSLHITATRKKQPVCSCTSTYLSTSVQKTEVIFNVLYPATILTVISNGNNISQQHISVIENKTLPVTCAAEGNPTPDIAWFLEEKEYIRSSNLTLANVRRNNTSTTYTCIATNLMNDTRESEHTNDSKAFTLIVLYPPSIRVLKNMSIIEGNSTSVVCKIIPGNPTQTYIRWNKASNNESLLLLESVNRNNSMWHTCEVNNTMAPTFGAIVPGIDTQRFYLEILYPPEKININSTSIPNHDVNDTIKIIVNTSIQLFCSAKGNPQPTSYWWSGLNTSVESEIYVHIYTTIKDKVTCFAKNVMRELPENKTYDGINNKTIFFDVLYPPEIENIKEIKVIEGQKYNINCLKTSGKTTSLSFKWIKENHEPPRSENYSSLNILNVSRNDAGQYGCVMQYEMKPTYGNSTSGNNNSSFAFVVLYPPELLNISLEVDTKEVFNITRSVSVIENASLVLNCSSLGNPLPSNYSWTGYQTNIYSAILRLKVTRNSRGNFTCTAKNKMDLSNGSSIIGQTSQVFEIDVQYPPELKEERYITSPEGKDVTLTCVLDYGRTVHSAVRWISSNGTIVQPYDNLTLLNVNRSSSGNYTCETNYTMAPSYRDPITAFMAKTVYLEVTSATYDEQKTPPGGGNVGQIAGGVIGGIIGFGAIVAALFLVRRRLHGKQLNAANKSSNLSLSQVCQYELKDNDCTITADSGISHVYEKLQSTGSDQQYQQLTSNGFIKENKGGQNTETADGGISNIYEKLHNAGADQQYQQLKTVDRMDNKGQHIVYENLRI